MEKITFTCIVNDVVNRFEDDDNRVAIHITTTDRESFSVLSSRTFFRNNPVVVDQAYSFDCELATANDTYKDEDGNDKNYRSSNHHLRNIRVENVDMVLFAIRQDALEDKRAKYAAKYTKLDVLATGE